MATTTNYGWTTPDDTALVKDGASAIRTLGTSIDTTTKNLNPSTTLGDIEYRSSTANTNTRVGIGSSGQGLQVVAGVPSWAASSTSTLTTTGDLLYASAANTLARRAIGSTGNVLTVAGGVPTWAAPAASGGITLISETVASALSSLSFSSIPSTYKELLLVWDGLYCSDATTRFEIRLNNVSTTTYYNRIFVFTTAGSITTGSGASVGSNENATMAMVNSNPSALEQRWAGSLRVYNYSSATLDKRYDMQSAGYNNSTGANRGGSLIGTFDSTTAISSIDVYRGAGTGTFSNATNTSIRLYGIS
jgi:hypothetical protein